MVDPLGGGYRLGEGAPRRCRVHVAVSVLGDLLDGVARPSVEVRPVHDFDANLGAAVHGLERHAVAGDMAGRKFPSVVYP